MNIIEQLDQEQMETLTNGKTIPDFAPGDTLQVNVKVVEGTRERVQAYEGVCIARAGGGINENFTVRKISYGEGVERVFPLYSPLVDSIKVIRKGRVRRAKLYYLRGLRGKAARLLLLQNLERAAEIARLDLVDGRIDEAALGKARRPELEYLEQDHGCRNYRQDQQDRDDRTALVEQRRDRVPGVPASRLRQDICRTRRGIARPLGSSAGAFGGPVGRIRCAFGGFRRRILFRHLYSSRLSSPAPGCSRPPPLPNPAFWVTGRRVFSHVHLRHHPGP
mgnify:CR=1 FL=1